MNYNSSVDGLNTIPPYEYAVPRQDESYDIADDLALFTNTDFLEWDPESNNLPSQMSSTNPAFGFENGASHGPQFPPNDFDPSLSNIDPDLNALLQQGSSQFQDSGRTSALLPRNHSSGDTSTTGTKRTHAAATATTPSEEDSNPKDEDEDALDVSAEEDKRRRNTAASARFRVKKKQREQQMEKTAKEMTDRVTSLENRIIELTNENRLLKGLLTEKRAPSSRAGSDEPAAKKAKVDAH